MYSKFLMQPLKQSSKVIFKDEMYMSLSLSDFSSFYLKEKKSLNSFKISQNYSLSAFDSRSSLFNCS